MEVFRCYRQDFIKMFWVKSALSSFSSLAALLPFHSPQLHICFPLHPSPGLFESIFLLLLKGSVLKVFLKFCYDRERNLTLFSQIIGGHEQFSGLLTDFWFWWLGFSFKNQYFFYFFFRTISNHSAPPWSSISCDHQLWVFLLFWFWQYFGVLISFLFSFSFDFILPTKGFNLKQGL